MSPFKSVGMVLTQSFPRVSGDEPLTEGEPPSGRMFSPRERG